MRIRSLIFSALIASFAFASYSADLPRSPSADNTKLYFIDLKDGATVSNPVVVRFGLSGMGIAPAGIQKEHTGHHHLLIDTALPTDLSQSLPTTENVRHFGGGQTEVSLQLAPGKHTLQLLLADHLHRPHQPVVASAVITITVK